MIDVIVPQVGEAIAEVTLVRWLKQVGDPVSKGEPLFEVDTEKATFEIEAFADGTLAEILAPDGTSVTPLQVVAKLAPNAGEAEMEPAHAAPTPAPSVERRPSTPAPAPPRARPAKLLATPRARRLARELGIDLAGVVGSGDRGTINVDDVNRAAEGHPASERGAESKSRLALARRLQASKQNVPHFYLQAEIDMSAVEAARADARSRTGEAPSVTTVVVKACALVLATDPSLNVRWGDEGPVPNNGTAIGVAVATDGGLQVVTLADAAALALQETALQLRQAAERARTGRLRPEDAAAKSMVVSNLGMHGVDAFFAIIDEPDPMILSVGRTTKRMVIIDGEPEIRPIATFGLSIDHRVLDGMHGARFLSRLRGLLESGDTTLLEAGGRR